MDSITLSNFIVKTGRALSRTLDFDLRDIFYHFWSYYFMRFHLPG